MKVKINIKNFNDRSLSNRFKEFLGQSADKEFNARVDIDNHYTKMYTLDEDTNQIKWLFHEDDLIFLGDNNE